MTKVGVLSFTFAFAGGIIYTGLKGVWDIEGGLRCLHKICRDRRLDGPKKTITFPKFSGHLRCSHKNRRDRRPRRSKKNNYLSQVFGTFAMLAQTKASLV